MLCKVLDGLVSRTCLLLTPFQVVGFINHQQIPFGRNSLFQAFRLLVEKRRRAKHQLGTFERVLRTGFEQGKTAFFIQDGEKQVKTSQHFNQPLVDQAVGHGNQHAVGTPGLQLLVDDQACFNGLAEPYLIGQQHPGCITVGDFTGNV